MEISRYKILKNLTISESLWDFLLNKYDYVCINGVYRLMPKKEIRELIRITNKFNKEDTNE